MKSTIKVIFSLGFVFLTESCQRQSQDKNTVRELKQLDERNEQVKDKAMLGTVPEPKPAKDVIFN